MSVLVGPRGVIYTLAALLWDLAGGIQLEPNNAQLLAYQGARFFEIHSYDLARSCLAASLRFEKNASIQGLLDRLPPAPVG
ncbi:MAG: hypothetical protein HZB53_06785 [Chloroflexi bacterium]|nr:hypothetical protein [Chloroflexota bacterium]